MRWLILLLVVINVIYFIWASNNPPSDIARASVDVNTVELTGANLGAEGQSLKASGIQTIELLPVSKAQPSRQTIVAALSNAAGDPAADTIPGLGGYSFCWYIGLPTTADQAVVNRAGSASAVEAVQQRLIAVGIEGVIETVKIAQPVRHLVYLPPFESRERALTRLKSLLAQGYDAYVFERGSLQNGISLDWFSQRAGAKRALARYRAEGLAAELRRIENYRSERWLVVSNAENGKIVDRLWRRIKNDWPGLLRQKNYCPGIAPVGDIE